MTFVLIFQNSGAGVKHNQRFPAGIFSHFIKFPGKAVHTLDGNGAVGLFGLIPDKENFMCVIFFVKLRIIRLFIKWVKEKDPILLDPGQQNIVPHIQKKMKPLVLIIFLLL